MLRRGRRSRPEQGSVLMLMPAAVLVLVVLGALAVDFSIAFLAQRAPALAAAAAANDAATKALVLEEFYGQGELRLDPAAAARIAADALDRHGVQDLDGVVVTVDVEPDAPVVRVAVEATVPYLFARAVPGAPRDVTVRAAATARAERS